MKKKLFYNETDGKTIYRQSLQIKYFQIATQEECEQMFILMSSCGIDKETGIKMLKERKEKFESAMKEYKSKTTVNK